jgi:hypothetical protein
MNQIILVVDDEKPIRMVLKDGLTAVGYGVETACNGEEALLKIPAFKPAIVLTDIIMPEMDGMELLKQTKILNPEVEVIVMTAFGAIETAVEAMKNGAYDFILKPLDFKHLNVVIQKCLEAIKIKKERDELSLLNEMKDKFIHLVNHEFRTPLSIGMASYDLLDMALDSGRVEDAKRMAPMLKKSLSHLNEFVQRFHDFALLKDGAMRLVPTSFDLNELISEVVDTWRVLAPDRKLSLEMDATDVPLAVFADRKKLHQVVMELLQNAMKFTPDGGTIKVSLKNLEKEGTPCTLIYIRDNGIGIPKEKQPLIFEKFYEVQSSLFHSTSKSRFMGGGLGLGLPYVKEIVEALGGKVSVESEEKKGSVFTVSIPMQTKEEKELQAPHSIIL